jgi:hypothetical protein
MTGPQGQLRRRVQLMFETLRDSLGAQASSSHQLSIIATPNRTHRAQTTRNLTSIAQHVQSPRCRHSNGRDDPNRTHQPVAKRRARREPFHRRLRERARPHGTLAFRRHPVGHRRRRSAIVYPPPCAPKADDAAAPRSALRAELPREY